MYRLLSLLAYNSNSVVTVSLCDAFTVAALSWNIIGRSQSLNYISSCAVLYESEMNYSIILWLSPPTHHQKWNELFRALHLTKVCNSARPRLGLSGCSRACKTEFKWYTRWGCWSTIRSRFHMFTPCGLVWWILFPIIFHESAAAMKASPKWNELFRGIVHFIFVKTLQPRHFRGI